MKLKFIDSLNNKKKKESTVETIATEMMIFKLQELLIEAKISLSLIKVMMTKTKRD
jgi:hypothetical protein